MTARRRSAPAAVVGVPAAVAVLVLAAVGTWLLSGVDRHLIVLPAVLGVVLITFVWGPRPGAYAAVVLTGVAVVTSVEQPVPLSVGDVIRIVLLAAASALIVTLGRRATKALVAAEQARATAVDGRRSAESAQATLQVLMDAAPIGMCLLDAELRVARANPAMSDVVGAPLHPHQKLADVRHVPRALLDVARQVEQSGRALVEREIAMATPAGERRLLVSGYPVAGHSGDDPCVGLTVHDVTESHRRSRQLEQAAAAAEALESAPTVQQRLVALCRRLVDDWTDLAVVLLASAQGLRAAVVQAREDVDAATLLELVDAAAEPGGTLDGALRQRRAAYLGPSELVAAAGGVVGSAFAALGASSVLVAPMSTVGQPQPLGLLLAATSRTTGRRHHEHELSTIAEIARLAVPAVQNGLLYERENIAYLREASRSRTLSALAEQQQQIARTLQSVLLPTELPEVAGLDLAAVYRAAADGLDVGGDVYDVFLSGDAVLILVADVAGKGAEATAATATVRQTIRAEAEHETSPAAILRRLNSRLLAEQLGGPFCTAALAWLQPCGAGWRLALARAGHPPPLVLNGQVQPLEPSGRLLGVFGDPDVVDHVSDLGPGTCLVLYSDGVTDVGSGADRMGEQGLRDLLATCAADGCAATSVCDHVLAAVLAYDDGRCPDDVAVVACRVVGGGAGEVLSPAEGRTEAGPRIDAAHPG